jgi:hypothetical protein
MGIQGERHDSGLIHKDKDQLESSKLPQFCHGKHVLGSMFASPILNLKFLSPILSGTKVFAPEINPRTNAEVAATSKGIGTSPQPS